jgi:hypothetical protein
VVGHQLHHPQPCCGAARAVLRAARPQRPRGGWPTRPGRFRSRGAQQGAVQDAITGAVATGRAAGRAASGTVAAARPRSLPLLLLGTCLSAEAPNSPLQSSVGSVHPHAQPLAWQLRGPAPALFFEAGPGQPTPPTRDHGRQHAYEGLLRPAVGHGTASHWRPVRRRHRAGGGRPQSHCHPPIEYSTIRSWASRAAARGRRPRRPGRPSRRRCPAPTARHGWQSWGILRQHWRLLSAWRLAGDATARRWLAATARIPSHAAVVGADTRGAPGQIGPPPP